MSGINTIVDTNVIGSLFSDKSFYKKNFSKSAVIGISIITKFKFLANPALGVKDKFLFEDLLENIEVYDLAKTDLALSQQIVSIRKKYKIKLLDAIIAATAIVCDATLLSADNIYSKIHTLKFKYIKI